MNTDTMVNNQGEQMTVQKPYKKAMVRLPILLIVVAAALFLSSGRIDWWMAWIYIGLMIVHMVIILSLIDPDLIEERTKIKKDAKKWDRIIVLLMVWVGPLAALIVAGLDMRHGWTLPLSLTLQILGIVFIVLGYVLGEWAMVKNRFFSAVVRIQKDRGHKVITDGPYHYIRHPGYVAGILGALGTPLLLGSYWAYIPFGFMIVVIVIRTALEDRTLHNELEGYREYASETRYRLFPGIW
jgi:protein-S-isoprenylcysteine O-methyltransferase Ste14